MSLSAVQAANKPSPTHHYASWATSPEQDFTRQNQNHQQRKESQQNERSIKHTTNPTHHLVLPRGFKRQGLSRSHRTPRRRLCRQHCLWPPRIDNEHWHENPDAGGP